MSRWKASGIHLALSAAIALAVVSLLALVWFPGPLFEATGSRELVMLLIAVDVTIGPVITLIVYRAGKRGMRFDLAVIALCQVAALAYGLHAFLATRPAFTVFAVDRFVVVPASQLAAEDLAAASDPAYRRIPWDGPKLVAAKLPQDPEEKQALLDSGLAGKDVERFPKYYERYENQREQVLARARPLDDLGVLGGSAKAALEEFVAAHGGDASAFVFLPLKIPRQDMIAVVRRADAAFEAMLPIEPPGRPR
ncbi:MAG TPA: TfpX/TfpZ family type IV pilin accessory protein [Xanthomonadales bacterium]|nr:TfpX/TfpZ family type IV pilin accessory protein [Xanthomonadales bacterium]